MGRASFLAGMTRRFSATSMLLSGIKKDTCRLNHGCQHTDGRTPFLIARLYGKLFLLGFSLPGGQLCFFPK
jgi:hypothetical protein